MAPAGRDRQEPDGGLDERGIGTLN